MSEQAHPSQGQSRYKSEFEWKVLQAPIGSCSCPELVAAVSNAGGLGALSMTWLSPEAIASLVRQCQQLTDLAFQGNFVMSFPVGEQFKAAVVAGIRVVTFSWGVPEQWMIELLRENRVCYGVQVVDQKSLEEALVCDPDFLIVQGVEAGGHVQAAMTTAECLEFVLSQAGGLPVVAAGGISAVADAKRMKALGASAVVLGTRFVASVESRAHELYKKRLIEDDGKDTILTMCFDDGWTAPHRVLRNQTLNDWMLAGMPAVGERPGEGELVARDDHGEVVCRYSDSPPLCDHSGDVGEMCLYSGSGVGAVHDVLPSAEITKLFDDAMS